MQKGGHYEKSKSSHNRLRHSLAKYLIGSSEVGHRNDSACALNTKTCLSFRLAGAVLCR